MTRRVKETQEMDGPICEPECELRGGKDKACGSLCPTKAELKASFPEHDQKQKTRKPGGNGVCRCVSRGSGSQLRDKFRAGCNQIQPGKSSLCVSVT